MKCFNHKISLTNNIGAHVDIHQMIKSIQFGGHTVPFSDRIEIELIET